jgi:hypothetical protein
LVWRRKKTSSDTFDAPQADIYQVTLINALAAEQKDIMKRGVRRGIVEKRFDFERRECEKHDCCTDDFALRIEGF